MAFTKKFFQKKFDLLEPISNRLMNENECSFFKVNSGNIQKSEKLTKEYQIYHSLSNNHLKKTCSYIIKYQKEDNKKIGIAKHVEL